MYYLYYLCATVTHVWNAVAGMCINFWDLFLHTLIALRFGGRGGGWWGKGDRGGEEEGVENHCKQPFRTWLVCGWRRWWFFLYILSHAEINFKILVQNDFVYRCNILAIGHKAKVNNNSICLEAWHKII